MDQVRVVAATTGLAACVLAAVFDPAERYAAAAYSPYTGRFGFAAGHRRPDDAVAEALARCESPDAELLAWVGGGYLAVAEADDRAFGCDVSAGGRADRQAAYGGAVAELRKHSRRPVRAVVTVAADGRDTRVSRPPGGP